MDTADNLQPSTTAPMPAIGATTCYRCGARLGDLGGDCSRGSVTTPQGPRCTFESSCERRLAQSAPGNLRFEVVDSKAHRRLRHRRRQVTLPQLKAAAADGSFDAVAALDEGAS